MVGEFHRAFVAAGEYFVHLVVVLVPLFVGGSFLVGLLGEYLPPERIERVLRRYDGGGGNVAAAGAGAVTPFCSCSTVPVLAGLLGAGAPLGMAFSFLLASPLVNELAVVLLVGLFGVRTAALYVAFTLAAAIAGGIVVGRLDLDSHVKDARLLGPGGRGVADGAGATAPCERSAVGSGSDGSDPLGASGAETAAGCGASTRPERACEADDCTSGPQSATHRARLTRAATGAREFFVDLFPYLLLGATVGAVVHGFVPTSLLSGLLGPDNPVAVPVAAVAGAPIYVSMSAMLPVAASFVDQGIPIGTVLAFVVGSAGVSLPNLVLLNELFDRTLLAVYALTVVTTGVLLGVVFNGLLP